MAWNASGGELWICFNRDEQRSRLPAEPPCICSGKDGFARICARDPVGGGTWLAGSETGFVIALMNNYATGTQQQAGPRSRGTLVMELIGKESFGDAETALVEMGSLSDFAPFYLFMLSSASAKLWSWDGRTLEQMDECPGFWTTSSFKAAEICSWRRNQWHIHTGGHAMTQSRAAHILRMRSGDPAYGMTMDRDDARTVSQSCMMLGKGILRMEYAQREKNGYSFEKPFCCSL